MGLWGPHEWPFKWVSEAIIPISGVITPFITGRGPPCMDEDVIMENPNSWDVRCWMAGFMQCLTSPLEQPTIFNKKCTLYTSMWQHCGWTNPGSPVGMVLVWWIYICICIYIHLYIHIIHNISLHFFHPFQMVQDVVHEEEQYYQLQWPLTGRSGPTTPDRGCGPQNGSWLAGKEEWSDTPITTG